MMSTNNAPLKIGPWQRLDSHVAYENPWLQVFHENVITPGGDAGIYGRVHFRNQAVAILPIDAQGNTTLVRQYRYTLDQPSWELPMGGCPRNESPERAALRELEEETGLRAGSIRQLSRLHPSNSITDEQAYCFLAEDLSPGQQQLESSEHDLEIKQLPFSEALNWAMTGRITDALSVAAIFHYALLLAAQKA